MWVKCVLLSLDSVKEHREDFLGSWGKNAEDTYAGNCVDSKWWLPPSCRGNVIPLWRQRLGNRRDDAKNHHFQHANGLGGRGFMGRLYDVAIVG